MTGETQNQINTLLIEKSQLAKAIRSNSKRNVFAKWNGNMDFFGALYLANIYVVESETFAECYSFASEFEKIIHIWSGQCVQGIIGLLVQGNGISAWPCLVLSGVRIPLS